MKQPNRRLYDSYKYSFLLSKETELLSSKDIFLQHIIQNEKSNDSC